jgi:hypothetical protein
VLHAGPQGQWSGSIDGTQSRVEPAPLPVPLLEQQLTTEAAEEHRGDAEAATRLNKLLKGMGNGLTGQWHPGRPFPLIIRTRTGRAAAQPPLRDPLRVVPLYSPLRSTLFTQLSGRETELHELLAQAYDQAGERAWLLCMFRCLKTSRRFARICPEERRFSLGRDC